MYKKTTTNVCPYKGMLEIFKASSDCHQLRARTFRAVFPQMFCYIYTHCEKPDGASCWGLFGETLQDRFYDFFRRK